MDKVKSVFDEDEFGDTVDASIKTAYEMALHDDAEERGAKRLLHASLSRPRELDDEDLCVRDGYRDIVSMMREIQLAGRTLSAARAEQYDPQGAEDVDPSTRPDYSYMDAVDDARRVSERLKAQDAAVSGGSVSGGSVSGGSVSGGSVSGGSVSGGSVSGGSVSGGSVSGGSSSAQ